MIVNPYKVLGVEDKAPIDVCKRAYRQLSRKYHPDNGGDASKFDEVSKAWEAIESGKIDNYILVGNNRSKHLRHKSIFNFELG